MWFNILVGNHGDIGDLEPLAPLVNYVRSALSACGHAVTVVQSALNRDAINLFLENFPNPRGWSERIHDLRQRHGHRIGVIATELVVNNTIPYARHGILLRAGQDEKDLYVQRRIEGLNAVAPEVDFMWSFFQRTAEEYRSRCRISRFFPVGHVFQLPGKVRESPKDIDIAFFGTMTPHRISVLEKLAAHENLNLAFVGRAAAPEHVPGFAVTGFMPSYIIASILDRAKIGLNLTLSAVDESPPHIDPRFVSCTRVVEMLEREVCVVSEEIPLDNPYRDFMVSSPLEGLTEACLRLLGTGEWRERGRQSAARFREDMHVTRVCAPVIDQTLEALAAP